MERTNSLGQSMYKAVRMEQEANACIITGNSALSLARSLLNSV